MLAVSVGCQLSSDSLLMTLYDTASNHKLNESSELYQEDQLKCGIKQVNNEGIAYHMYWTLAQTETK